MLYLYSATTPVSQLPPCLSFPHPSSWPLALPQLQVHGEPCCGPGEKHIGQVRQRACDQSWPSPANSLLPLSQDGALSHRNRNKWLEAWEGEGRGQLLNKALVLNAPHCESMTSFRTFNYACSPPLRIFVFTWKKRVFWFCFCFEDKDIQPMGTLISTGL